VPVNQGPRTGLYTNRVMRPNEQDIVRSEGEWQALADTAEIVGECRQMYPAPLGKCDGVMFALPTPDYQIEQDPIHWQGAQCNVCLNEVAIPNRRALRRSSAHGEMPVGYWEGRQQRLRPAMPDA